MFRKYALAILIATAVWGQAVPAWNRNAAFGESETFDLCNGHQPGDGMYHYHLNPLCLRAALGTLQSG